MIQNALQLSVTKERLKEFKESIAHLELNQEISPLEKKLYKDAMTSQVIVLEEEIEEYNKKQKIV